MLHCVLLNKWPSGIVSLPVVRESSPTSTRKFKYLQSCARDRSNMPCRLVSPHLVHTTSVLCLVPSLDNPPSDFELDLDLDLDLIVGGSATAQDNRALPATPTASLLILATLDNSNQQANPIRASPETKSGS